MKKPEIVLIITGGLLITLFTVYCLLPKNKIRTDSATPVSMGSNYKLVNKQSTAEELPFENEFVGLWHATPAMAAGWNDRYHLFSGGRFRFDYSQMICDSSHRMIGFSGKWEVADNRLILTVTEKTVIEGGTPVDGGSSVEFEGGVVRKISVTPPERMEKEISQVGTEIVNDTQRKVVIIGGKKYWYCGSPDEGR